MKQISLRNTAKSRRGFSLVEVVVGLTVVVMVTIAALSLMISSIQMEQKYLNKTTALCACESAVAVVRYADDARELAEGLALLADADPSIPPVQNNNMISFQQNNVRITVNFTADPDTNIFLSSEFTITATSLGGEEVLHQVTYEK